MTFDSIFVPDHLRAAVSDQAWLVAMLEAERALAHAEARAELIPADAAKAIAEACRSERFDLGALLEEGRSVGNPVEPLARALRREVGGEAADYVHWGATSQDILDTAAMLVARRGLEAILKEVDAVSAACARLAEEHRSTPMAGRTLLQQAVPTTFGLRAAGWLAGVLDAARLLRAFEPAAQLGGAAGTLAPLGERALDVRRLFADELDLAFTSLPWHTNRVSIAQLGAALDIAAGAVAKIGLDVILLSQNEVAEVAEPGNAGSSTMPQKRNPVRSTLARACATQAHAHAGVLMGALGQELDRAAGAWHAEWGSLSAALALTGGAAAAIRGVVEGLEVDTERMRSNLGQDTVSERVAFVLAERHGREQAHRLVAETALAALDVPPETLDPATYLGSAEAFVDAALERYRAETR